MYEVAQFIPIPDPEGNEIWDNNFALPDWSAPISPSVSDETTERPKPELESPMTPEDKPTTVRTVTIKFFKLKEHEQRRVITQLKLDRSGDRDLKDYEFVIHAVRRSVNEGSLQELDALLDRTLAERERGGL
jgi:hypothetical protein